MRAGVARESFMGGHHTRQQSVFMEVQLSARTKEQGKIAEAKESKMFTSSATKHWHCVLELELVSVLCGTNDTKPKVFHESWRGTGKPHGSS